MRALVTGVAGFIGSTLGDRLVAEGWDVRGIDSLTPYYDPQTKWSNMSQLVDSPSFELREADLGEADVRELMDDVDVVFHLAGQPGVRLSWADGFRSYSEANINVTQRLLEAARICKPTRFVYASSSSVYGDVDAVPTGEDQPTRPYSPYGVTKLAGEHLCRAYARNFGVSTTSLRFFTVYGPRQRPDMAFHRLIESALTGSRFSLYGDGKQIRDFTYVDDIVAANILAGTSDLVPGAVLNVAGGGSTELLDVVELVGELVGAPVDIEWHEAQPGDVTQTGGSINLAGSLLGWVPAVDLRTGLARQVEWHRERSEGSH